jgi:hypothetical protein
MKYKCFKKPQIKKIYYEKNQKQQKDIVLIVKKKELLKN